MNDNPGTEITVQVEGKDRKTVIDSHGTQRFKRNRIIRDLLDQASKHGLDMNFIVRRAAEGNYNYRELRQLYRLIGYSVCGYGEIFGYDKIENPLWEGDEKTTDDKNTP